MNPNFVSWDVYVVFPGQMDRQRYPVGAHVVFFLYWVDTLRLPVIVMGDVPWGDDFLIVEVDRCMGEACLVEARRWSKAHH